MLNEIIFFFFEKNGSQITGKRILVQFVVVYFLKGQEPFQHLQMKQEIKLLSSEAHLASAEHKPDPPQKLCSCCCVFTALNLQHLVLRQGLGKTQLNASGSR